ncbi:MAG TPA: hypothetical protein VMV83_01370 [Rectinemataceae bacterium]|nr:hypothetical protein [Rectinemataceae bacterium]
MAFTLVEAAAAIAVLSLLALIGFTAVTSASAKAAHYLGEATFAHRLVSLDATLRASLARVKPPFWATAASVEVSSESAHVSYLDGESSSVLEISSDGRTISFVLPEGRQLIGPFDGVEFRLLSNADGSPIGLAVRVARGTYWYEAKAVFSSIALYFKEGS